jgi:predicted DNA-binding protein
MGRSKANKEVAAAKKSEFASVRLGRELKYRLENIADEEGRSLSNLIRRMLEREVRKLDILDDRVQFVKRIAAEGKSPVELEIEAAAAQESQEKAK